MNRTPLTQEQSEWVTDKLENSTSTDSQIARLFFRQFGRDLAKQSVGVRRKKIIKP